MFSRANAVKDRKANALGACPNIHLTKEAYELHSNYFLTVLSSYKFYNCFIIYKVAMFTNILKHSISVYL